MYYDPISRLLFNAEIWVLNAVALILASVFVISLIITIGGVAWLCFRKE